MNGWTLNSGVWNSSGVETINNSYQGDSAVITDANATDSNTLGNLKMVLAGANSLRLNNSANGGHFSTLTQSVTNYEGSDLYFGFAAVLENPVNPHTEAQTPKFSFTLVDNTKNLTLYSVSFDSRNASANGITWKSGLATANGPSTWMYSDWNIIHIDTSAVQGDQLTLTVKAYDCALGGHGGYAYVDAFQPTPITPNAGVTVNPIEASSLGDSVPEASTWVMGLLLTLGAFASPVRRLLPIGSICRK